MRKTIMGFDQQKLFELNVKMDEVCILSWIQCAMGSPKMKHIQDKDTGEIYIWMCYEKFMEDFPIITIKQDSLRLKIKKLKDIGLLKQLNISNEKNKGSRMYFAKTELFNSLLFSDQVEKIQGGTTDQVEKIQGGTTDQVEKIQGQYNILINNNKLIKDKLINNVEQSPTVHSLEKTKSNNSNETSLESFRKNYTINSQQQLKEVVDYLNKITGKKYKSTTADTSKQILARLKDGYTVEQMKQVIDSRWNLWKGTDMEQYVRPSTLFRPGNFENYLNNLGAKRKVIGRGCPDMQDTLGQSSGKAFKQLDKKEQVTTLSGRKF